MKKMLLATTGLAGFAMLLAGAAAAETPKVTVGGFADFQAGWIDDDAEQGERDYAFRNDSEVIINVDAKSDYGLEYGAEIALEADVSADTDREGLNASRTFVYLGGLWGRFELGSNTGAEQAMKVDASNFAAATGGIDGDWYRFALSNYSAPGAIIRPRLPIAHGGFNQADGLDGYYAEDQINAAKITYYTPRFAGFQGGVSFTPDTQVKGQGARSTGTALTGASAPGSAGLLNDNDGAYENVVSGGLRYEGNFNSFGLAASGTAEWGNAETTVFGSDSDLFAWQAGANVTFLGFIVGGSYGDYQATAGDNGHYYTAGGGYDFGPFGASVTYLNSQAVGGDLENLSIGLDYKMAPGLTPYAEVSLFDFDDAGVGNSNDGTVVLLGTQLAF